MAYAVVKFISNNSDEDDDVASEVPRIWLMENNKKCWWPKGKNVNTLITKQAVPNATNNQWELFDVQFENYYETLEKARRRACYITSSDEALSLRGRGFRKKKPCQRPSNDSSESENEEPIIPPPPKNDYTTVITPVEAVQSTSMIAVNTPINEGPVLVDMDNTLTIAIVSDKTEELRSFLADNFEKLFKALSTIKLEINLTNERLARLETGNTNMNSQYQNNLHFQDFIPFKIWDELLQFEELLKESEFRDNFFVYLQHIGGADPKESLLRILKRLFSNKLAQECSWLGRRNNKKICHLLTISVAKEVLLLSFNTLKEKEFEDVASEWFRQAKQRFAREEKKSNVPTSFI